MSNRTKDISKDSDHHTGYFCYNCVYFIKPNHCAIVTDEGPDVYGKTSGQIAPHGICALWEPNKEEIHYISSSSGSAGKSDESTTNVSASFSSDICNAQPMLLFSDIALLMVRRTNKNQKCS